MIRNDIQEYYDAVCAKHNVLRVIVFFVNDVNYKGLYIEWPFPKIYLNENLYTERTVYHEIFHHLNPSLNDGDEFEKLLDTFINEQKFELCQK